MFTSFHIPTPAHVFLLAVISQDLIQLTLQGFTLFLVCDNEIEGSLDIQRTTEVKDIHHFSGSQGLRSWVTFAADYKVSYVCSRCSFVSCAFCCGNSHVKVTNRSGGRRLSPRISSTGCVNIMMVRRQSRHRKASADQGMIWVHGCESEPVSDGSVTILTSTL